MEIAVMGAGREGLAVATSLAAAGHRVSAHDSHSERLFSAAQGRPTIFEPNLTDRLRNEMAAGRLEFRADPAGVLTKAEVVFLCADDPVESDDPTPGGVVEAASLVMEYSDGPVVLVDHSASPLGASVRISDLLRRNGLEDRYLVVCNPNFARPGRAMSDLHNPECIVVGTDSPAAADTMRSVYGPHIKRGAYFIECDLRSAEIAKYASSMLAATKESFVNSLVRLCEAGGYDIAAVLKTLSPNHRLGTSALEAVFGSGGSTFESDLSSLAALTEKLGLPMGLLNEIEKSRDVVIDSILAKVKDTLWSLTDKRIGLLGLSVRPQTDDVSGSKAIVLAERLLEEGANVVGYDSHAGGNAKAVVADIEVVGDAFGVFEGSHCVVVATPWDEFRVLDLARARSLMAFPVLVDAASLYRQQDVIDAGFTYYRFGAAKPVSP